MGLIVKRETARSSRGKQQRRTTVLSFGTPDIFDLQYKPEQHERFVRREIRSLLRPRRFDLRTVETAKRWREAIQREAPLLKGFFEAEPKLRGQMLRWLRQGPRVVSDNEPLSSAIVTAGVKSVNHGNQSPG